MCKKSKQKGKFQVKFSWKPQNQRSKYRLHQKDCLELGDMLISLVAMPIQDKGMVNTLRVTEITSCSF